MENKMEMKELNLNEMSGAAGGNPSQVLTSGSGDTRILYKLGAEIYKKLFAPTKTLD